LTLHTLTHLAVLQATGCQTAYAPSFTWWFPAAGLIVAVGAGAFARFLEGWRRVFLFVIAGLALLWVLGAGVAMLNFYVSARTAANAPMTPVVEGVVENFRPAPPGGHVNESFSVNGVQFAYSDYMITGGFRQTASHGGPIRAGLHVRVHYVRDSSPYVGNLIVKLEICP